ncbi:HupE/UreJ family protein [Zavarzinella formosa]|uniref:HupE/UreJ family protein n=1 Tax=Zavarzinella formosa TaxID=360055 RepID=UPI0012FC35E0|nr:HupE/UreJ family protein [Zavarzinella formosa]
MNIRIAILLLVILPWLASPAYAHQLDEYLQATTVAVKRDRVVLEIRMVAGAEVAKKVLAGIDTDGDQMISEAEQHAYAERVRLDLATTMDGNPLTLRPISLSFPTVEEVIKGRGDIVIEFEADMPPGASAHRLALENRHHSAIAVYLVNCLMPRDPGVRIIDQNRNLNQSSYQLDFALDDAGSSPAESNQWAGETGGLAVMKSYFIHGVHHILTGYDHLLFVAALALAAATFWELVKVVTAFTLAHSLTLTLAALDLVHLPERVVEPLIAASIVFVAVQNILGYSQGRGRLAAAFFFGLFHGLGFAGGLLDLMHQMPRETVLSAIFGFSVGVETGHLTVLLPLFVLLAAIRRSQREVTPQASRSMAIQRYGSTGILVAGVYFLCMALAGQS